MTNEHPRDTDLFGRLGLNGTTKLLPQGRHMDTCPTGLA